MRLIKLTLTAIFLTSLYSCGSNLAVPTPSHVSVAITSLAPTTSHSITQTRAAVPASATRSPIRTATIPPVSSATVVPGAMDPAELQLEIDRWVSGQTPFTENDRLLDEVTGQPVNLGLYDRALGQVFLVYYALGTGISVDDQGTAYVLNIAGMEDRSGGRFTFPINVGDLADPCAITIFQKWKGRWINHGDSLISAEELSPAQFLRNRDQIDHHTVLLQLDLLNPGGTESQCVNKTANYFFPSKDTLVALVELLECKDCGYQDAPSDLRSLMNNFPARFDPRIPYSRVYKITIK